MFQLEIDDLARLCVVHGRTSDDCVIDAVGPESPTFLELVASIRAAVGSRSRIVRVPPSVLPPMAWLLGILLHDVLLTREEFDAMAAGLATTSGPATGTIALSDWLTEHGPELGRHYANELDRHFDERPSPTTAGSVIS